MKKIISMIVLMFLCGTTLFASPAKEESVRELIELSGSKNIGKMFMNQLLPNLKRLAPDAPEEFWDKMTKEIDMDKMVELTIPIYQKYLNEEDIQAINKFYKTEAGQKLIKQTPQIMQESMMAGQQWGREIAQKIVSELKEKEYIKQNMK
ncbi:DUF2059 domain-containing protein [Arcobacter sp.]|uniref:DUF2059 domain-containing protein n=1 Tax=Arcobacter sp. TaxID=1872629 RepID=UPI003C73BD99